MTSPQPPTGVRVVRAGIEYPCQVEYRGLDDDCHMWEVVDEYCDLEAGDRLLMDVMPAHTGIVWSARPTCDQ